MQISEPLKVILEKIIENNITEEILRNLQEKEMIERIPFLNKKEINSLFLIISEIKNEESDSRMLTQELFSF